MQPRRSHLGQGCPRHALRALQALKDAGDLADRAQIAAIDKLADPLRSDSRGQDQMQSQPNRGMLVQVKLAG